MTDEIQYTNNIDILTYFGGTNSIVVLNNYFYYFFMIRMLDSNCQRLT